MKEALEESQGSGSSSWVFWAFRASVQRQLLGMGLLRSNTTLNPEPCKS